MKLWSPFSRHNARAPEPVVEPPKPVEHHDEEKAVTLNYSREVPAAQEPDLLALRRAEAVYRNAIMAADIEYRHAVQHSRTHAELNAANTKVKLDRLNAKIALGHARRAAGVGS